MSLLELLGNVPRKAAKRPRSASAPALAVRTQTLQDVWNTGVGIAKND
jgi:hypothetical protein